MVIGGGAVGVCTAYYLAKTGRSVSVVERTGLASEATGHNQRIIIVQTKVPGPLAEIGLRTMRLHAELQEELGDDFGSVRSGTLMVYETEEVLDAAKATLGAKLAAGLNMAVAEGKDLQELEPALAPDLVGGILCRDDFLLDPVRFTQAVAAAAKVRGVRILEGVQVTGIRRKGTRVQAVETSEGPIGTERVVCAAGAWSSEIGAMVGVRVPVRPRRGQLIETAPTPPLVHTAILEGGYEGKTKQRPEDQAAAPDLFSRAAVTFVFVQDGVGRCWMGGSREYVGFRRGTDPDVLNLIRERTVRFLPGLPPLREVGASSNFRPYSEDQLPLIGEVPNVPGFYLATGHEGSGLTLAPVTGELIAQLIAEGGTRTSIEALSPARLTAQNH